MTNLTYSIIKTFEPYLPFCDTFIDVVRICFKSSIRQIFGKILLFFKSEWTKNERYCNILHTGLGILTCDFSCTKTNVPYVTKGVASISDLFNKLKQLTSMKGLLSVCFKHSSSFAAVLVFCKCLSADFCVTETSILSQWCCEISVLHIIL